jgi:hypothetical protein
MNPKIQTAIDGIEAGMIGFYESRVCTVFILAFLVVDCAIVVYILQ